jgi:cyclopropane fatty-acyl-phospholipid synthase-like methyltransferase
MERVNLASRYDALISGPRMKALYGESGYFNAGLWDSKTKSITEACDRLVDEVASVVPKDATLILDVGCGLGAGTRRIMQSFPRAFVLGINLSHWQLTQARQRGVTASTVMDASHLAVSPGIADAVIALESAQHFDTRAQFFAEAYRVLRPGGIISLADMLFADLELGSDWMMPPANAVRSMADYAHALVNLGYEDIALRDATDVCWRPFCALLGEVFSSEEEVVRTIEESLWRYVIVFARKP